MRSSTRQVKIPILFAAIAIMLLLVVVVQQLLTIGYRKEGIKGFESIGLTILQYRHDKNQLPSSLEDVYDSGFDIYPILQRSINGNKNTTDLLDKYVYIDWNQKSTGTNVPGDYPILYSRFQSLGGIFVLRVDGQAFWDRDARRLNAFVRDHPQYDLLLVEDEAKGVSDCLDRGQSAKPRIDKADGVRPIK